MMRLPGIRRLALIALAVSMLLGGCGYRPVSHYSKAVTGETVSTKVIISMEDPENTVIIKDAVDSAVIMRFHSSLREYGEAQTHLDIYLQSVVFQPLQFDEHGYIITYRTRITLRIVRKTGDVSKRYKLKGTHDFAIEPNAIISDQARFTAIKSGSAKAIDSFIAQVAAEGALTKDEEEPR